MRLLVCGLTLLGSNELCTGFPRSCANPNIKALSNVGNCIWGWEVRSSHWLHGFGIQALLIITELV